MQRVLPSTGRSSNMIHTTRVYTASKLHHAPTWRAMQIQYKDWLVITSRWITMPTFEEGTTELCRNGWVVDDQDVRHSNFVLCYAKDGELLRGALVEAGMGIAYGKKILCVGASDSFGTWQWHPQVVLRTARMQEALDYLKASAS